MITALRLSTRVTIIVVVALLAGFLILVATSYRINGFGGSSALPAPERLAALAGLLEQASPAQSTSIIKAVSTPLFAPQIIPHSNSVNKLSSHRPHGINVAQYEAALEGRAFSIRPSQPTPKVGYRLAGELTALEFQILLATGETLLIETQSPFVVAAFGLPVGFGAALVGIFVALVTLVVLHREFRPLAQLAAALDNVEPASGVVPLKPIRARSPELRALIRAFERLQDRISTLIRARLALVGGIEHDIRTFAARLRLRVEKIEDPVERERAICDITDVVSLLDDALLASRAGVSELDEELVEFEILVAAEVNDRSAAGAAIHWCPGDNNGHATVLGDRLALRRIVANLIENGLKYGHAVYVQQLVDTQWVTLYVDDEGPGIACNQRALLLEPFTRLESSRGRDTGGAGLGLAVVNSLTQAHGGSIQIADAPSGGARFIVKLPLFYR